MEGSNPPDRTISAKNSPIAGSSKVIGSVATEWTNEMHKSYLNSVEASFVKQLYSSQYGSNDLLGWLSRTEIQTNPGPGPEDQSSSQFKVLRRGCWENRKFDKVMSQTGNENESQKLSENSWIQHFRPHAAAKGQHLKPADLMQHSNLGGQSVHGREATSSKQPPHFYSHRLQQVSVGSVTEVSDQNFEDVEVEREEPSRRSRKKRVRGAVSPIKDQVVPFMVPTPRDKISFLKDINEGGRNRNLEPQSSLSEDEQQSELKLEDR